MVDRITIRKPDDWHLHVRDEEMMKASLPHTAKHFGRAIMMPNLIPPVRTTADAIAYRGRLLEALPQGSTFKPLMTCYLADDTSPDDVERGFRDGVFTGVKLYPANATTNSAAGVTDYRKIKPVLARMEKIGMRFLMHGEDVDPAVDVFDREAAFLDKYLEPWTREFPGLKMILEHVSSKEGVDFVKAHAPQARRFDHALITSNSTAPTGSAGATALTCIACRSSKPSGTGRRSGRRRHQARAVTFLARILAPHSVAKKLAVTAPLACFNSPVAMAIYAKVFDEENALGKLEAFASLNGPKHYGLQPNDETITLERKSWVVPEDIKIEGPEERALIYRGGETLQWQVVSA